MNHPAPRKPRVLHVLKGLPLGGIETWLMHVLRRDRNSFVQHELLLMVEGPGDYEPEARELGIPIHKVLKKGSWLRWFADLRRFLKDQGPFDALHSPHRLCDRRTDRRDRRIGGRAEPKSPTSMRRGALEWTFGQRASG